MPIEAIASKLTDNLNPHRGNWYICGMDARFGKAYKLCSKKIQDSLFTTGNKVSNYPLTLFYLESELPTPKSFQITISVPKRAIRKAHDRNRIKRMMRECFRQNKVLLEDKLATRQKQMALFLIYRMNEEPSYEVLQQKTKKLITKFIEQLETHESH